MKLLIFFLLLGFCFSGYSQTSNNLFYHDVLLKNKLNKNDSVYYFVLKIKIRNNKKIENITIVSFKEEGGISTVNDSIVGKFNIDEIVSDTTFKLKNDNDIIICPYIIKKVRSINNPSGEYIFNAIDLNKLFELLKFTLENINSKFIFLKPSILFLEDSYS